MVEEKIQYNLVFKIPITSFQEISMTNYLILKGYVPVFSSIKGSLSGTLSLDKRLEQEDCNMLINTTNIKFITEKFNNS